MKGAVYAITQGVLSSHYEGESVLVHLDSKRCFRLNATGAEIWRGLEEGLGEAEIAARLRRRFDVSDEDASAAVTRLVRDLEASDLVRAAGEAP